MITILTLAGGEKMTDDEKKQPEGSFRPGLVILRVILWTIIFSFLAIYLMGN